MQKLTSLLILTTLCSTFAKADFYVGTTLGRSFSILQHEAELEHTQPFDIKTNINIKALAEPTLMTSLIAGYDYTTQSHTYISVEGNASLNPLCHEYIDFINNYASMDGWPAIADPLETKIKLKIGSNALYGLYLQIGQTLDNNITPFISCGATWQDYTIEYIEAFSNHEKTTQGNITIKQIYITPGIGLKYKFNQWLFSIQYQYSRLSEPHSIKYNVPLADNVKEKFQTGEHMFKLGVAYCF